MIPTRRLVLLAALIAIPLMFSSINRDLADLALLVNLVLVAVAAVDLLISPDPDQIDVRREISEVLSVGASNPASLIVRNRSFVRLRLSLHDDPGSLCRVERLPQTIDIAQIRNALFTTSSRLIAGELRSWLPCICGIRLGWGYGSGNKLARSCPRFEFTLTFEPSIAMN